LVWSIWDDERAPSVSIHTPPTLRCVETNWAKAVAGSTSAATTAQIAKVQTRSENIRTDGETEWTITVLRKSALSKSAAMKGPLLLPGSRRQLE
jgi:hypothetical protein